MKYKLLGATVCLCAIIAAMFAPLFTAGASMRVHQHRIATQKTLCTHDDSVFCTHLPLVEIDTGGVTIPGKPIHDEKGKTTGYTLANNGETHIHASMQVIDNEKTNNHADDLPAIHSDIEIRVRGRSSREFEKSSYYIKMVNGDGTNNEQKMMGMDAHSEWVLYGPYLDKTFLRNYMWYNIAGEMMDYAPNVRFCEVMLNGEYMGLYVMVEKITAGDDGARLKLAVNKKNNTFSGYLLRLDLEKINPRTINQFTSYTRRTLQQLEIMYPGTKNITDELATAISKDFSNFEKSLYSYDFDHEKYGYRSYIDPESFIDYFLINEFTCNYDAGWLSTYIYKDSDGKYRMCIWDFNSACDNYQKSQTEPMVFQMQNALWYFMLMKDEDFTEQLIDRYWELRKLYLNEEYLNSYIDETIAFLGDAIDRNYKKWGYTFEKEYDMLTPEERNPRDFKQAVAQLREFFPKRIAWMDENIDILRQYSAESKIKKFNENAN